MKKEVRVTILLEVDSSKDTEEIAQEMAKAIEKSNMGVDLVITVSVVK